MFRHEAVFLDRDGVINENRPDHVKGWPEFKFVPGAIDALATLTRAGVKIFVVTNQSVINRQLISREEVERMHMRMQAEVASEGGRIEDVAYCPHRPDEGCNCRKPKPGLLHLLAKRHDLDLRRCAVVGDSLADIEAGNAAGCDTILVLTGRGGEQHALAKTSACAGTYCLADDLHTAVNLLLASEPALAVV